ncbi:N,N-dimethylformamidase beta subunit family domain-containing protein [Pigmentiphaga litoralis]|uniref:N,N-dimethylformamidase beta subunit-like C-terminal domain-containing protein n=1 Tax=Pigmentiphaga litoralis TaxID=516702 RepID=A0A7Y9IT32_9BURK|nr:N,N-dimethylformamidase beta subunit family domain-containing protein [Pigmentiphaga litoralis]NYE23880.1 hypothetical protein [Pigmentiphaga litoralis]NYE82506.1 hypothetical protein [Pigmentiphaga litoralis]
MTANGETKPVRNGNDGVAAKRPGTYDGIEVDAISGRRQGARETWVEVPERNGYPAAWCYTDKRSYLPGDTVRLHLSSNVDAIAVRAGRDDATSISLHQTRLAKARFHPLPERAYEHGCDWPVFTEWTLPAHVQPGAYLVEAIDSTGAVLGHHLFFVKPVHRRASALALVVATSTWTAYNDWGGANHYYGLHPGTPRGRSPRLSIHRPWARGQIWLPSDAPRSMNSERADRPGSARYEFIEWASIHGFSKYYALAGWATYERPFVLWAEKHGFEVDLITQDELHSQPDALDGYACAVFVGHDEYWTREMRDHVDAFITRGGNVARFAGNFMWQIRLEDNGATQVAYKYDARTQDPARDSDPGRLTSAWEDPLVNHPGASTFGVNALRGIYAGFGGMARQSPRGYSVFRPEHWAFAGTGLGYADMFGSQASIFGYEVDGLDYTFHEGRPEPLGSDGALPGLEILAMGWATSAEAGRPQDSDSLMLGDRDAHFRAAMLESDTSPATVQKHSRGCGMIVHFKKGRGQVFTAATCEWVAGLCKNDFATVTITRNVLKEFLKRSI